MGSRTAKRTPETFGRVMATPDDKLRQGALFRPALDSEVHPFGVSGCRASGLTVDTRRARPNSYSEGFADMVIRTSMRIISR